MYVNGAAGPKSSGSAPSSIHLPAHQHDISCYSRSAWLLVILLGKVSHVEMLFLDILLTTLQFCLFSEWINLLRILIKQKKTLQIPINLASACLSSDDNDAGLFRASWI